MTTDRCLIIAEIGLNHNGQLDLARQSVEAAAKAGCDAVKFQNFKTEDFTQDRAQTFTYKSQGKEVTESFYDLCKRNEFKSEWMGELKSLSDELNVAFLSTPTSEEGIRTLKDAGCAYIKNGSDYLTHLPLLKAMADSGMHVIVSTGMADDDDIKSALGALAAALPERVTLLHCTSNYPTAPEDTNLKRMTALADRYGLPVGFSDHTAGWLAAVQAVTLGATMIEKHFTLDRNLPGPDHWFSSTPEEMTKLVAQVRLAETSLGRADIRPADGEMAIRDEFRIGLVAAKKIAAGSTLTEDMVAFRKPAKGLLPRDLPNYLGRRLGAEVDKEHPLSAEDFDE
ncbi:MAG: N-acetylneuraminate synthase family protein [Rhodospirillales bacterium]|nr:N-acetylneuraminate synthase family protein [Rhodospirillales bacterium]